MPLPRARSLFSIWEWIMFSLVYEESVGLGATNCGLWIVSIQLVLSQEDTTEAVATQIPALSATGFSLDSN
jgi:hypothetical protein